MITMPNNTLVASSKLFRTKAPWRISGSLMGQMTKDHDVLLFDHNPAQIPYDQMAKKIGKYMYPRLQRDVNNLVFIGYEHECRLLADLYTTTGFKFDCAVLVNNVYDQAMYDSVLGHTAIYNFWTKTQAPYGPIDGAEENEFVKTLLPAHMSNRLAQEISGCLLYGFYNLDYLDSNKPIFNYIS